MNIFAVQCKCFLSPWKIECIKKISWTTSK